MPDLLDLDVLIVDCQTTGASPALGSILELGWGIARGNAAAVQELQAHWVALPPKHVVPFQIRRLTGFDEADVRDALPPEDAWQRLRTAMKPAGPIPAAIHFAKFELAFLCDWASRFAPAEDFPLDAVCVHAIACRLYPDLPRRSLRALAGYLGYGLDPARRRSLAHVEATAFIWRKVAAELAVRGIRTWEELGTWLASPAAANTRSSKRRYPFPSARYRALPDEPGVYQLLRSNGDVLYVGKAASLRKRVTSHFTGGAKATERALEMLTQVNDLRVTPTRTALEAAMLENESIKEIRPPYNVQLIGEDPRTWFTDTSLDGVSSHPDDIHRLGPLPSTFSVRALGAITALAAGAMPSLRLRARAVEVAEWWAPNEATFAAGFASFAARHALSLERPLGKALGDPSPRAVDPARGKEMRRALENVAKKLILAAKSEAALEADAGADATAWDADRVVRHIERAVAHGYQLLQRCRWLCLLYDSALVFQEPPSVRPRLLLMRNGRVVEARDLLPDEPMPPSVPRRSLRDRQASFDRSQYDRLRTLTTEVKRVLRDGGSAAVCLGRQRWIRGSKLDALLRWV